MSNKTIYIVDDEADVAETLKGLIEAGLSYECKTFDSLESCLKILGNEPADLIISDIMMPTGSGLRFGQILKERSLEIPVIYISGHADKISDSDITLLRKPVQKEKLFTTVQSILSDR